MKKSIKIASLLAAIMGATFAAKAQTQSAVSDNGIVYSIGVESGLSTGRFADSHKWNLGGSVQADIPVLKNLYFTVNTGYQNYFGKSDAFGTNLKAIDIQIIPIKAGIKYFPVHNIYLQGEAGAAFAVNKNDLGYNNTATFIYAPQVGVQFPLSGKSCVDASVRYEASTKFNSADNSSKVNFIGLRLAYTFGLK